MYKEIEIGGRKIGPSHPPVVIAEIGINHEGVLATAIEMADAAIDAGAEIIKHQTHIIADEMSEEAKLVIPGNANVSIYEIMSRCALGREDEKALMDHVKKRGAIFISTPFSRSAVDRLIEFDVPAFKIGSGECNNLPLIKYIAKIGRPIILSTGMNDIKSISPAVNILRDAKVPYALLHCTNIYPTPPEHVRLGAILKLQESFPDAILGLSDHTTSNHTCFGAVALGACILERHFTDQKDRPGPDIVCSMDPPELRDLIKGSHVIWSARGGDKSLIDDEKATSAFAFSSVVSIKNISAGEFFTMENIWVKRPGGGDFSAIDFESLLGKRSACDIRAGIQIKDVNVVK